MNVLYGSGSGLTAAGDQLWHQNVPGGLGGAEAGDVFGGSLASGDYDGDGNLLKGSAPDVYVMEAGQKRHAVSKEVFLGCGYQWRNVNRIADSTIAAIPDGSPLSACTP